MRLTRKGTDSPFVSRSTEWFVLIGEEYPWGRLKFCPAKEGGLTCTFPHQEYNGEGPAELPWRSGELCLNTTTHVLGRHGFDSELFGAGGRSGRLRWHVLRALDWLQAAADGTLMRSGDLYEVPHFPGVGRSDTTVTYSEGAAAFARWAAISEQFGVLELAPLMDKSSVLVISGFFSNPRTLLLPVSWGRGVVTADAAQRGVWLRLPAAPVLDPWQAPRNWQELCKCCRAWKVDLDRLLMRPFRYIRDGKQHILLVGFPIPERLGGPNCRMHWQPLRLPVLCQGAQSLAGFRPNRETTRYHQDRRTALTGTAEIEWLRCENWDSAQLGSRGRLPAGIAERHVLLVGGGALGSPLAELLVRAGVRRLTVVDGQNFEAGNLCRHTLSMLDLKSNKAEGLARRLNQVGPHCVIDAIPENFPPAKDEERQKLLACDVVIDCTGDDRLLHEMARFPWGRAKRFVSLSLGLGARRLFCFVADGESFPADKFRRALHPWLMREGEEAGDVELPREGVGCWHPVFPARADDVWMMASVAVKQVERALTDGPVSPKLTVFEQSLDASRFAGVMRFPAEAPDGE